METQKDRHGFCTLALGERYHWMARDLIQDLATHAPGTKIVVYTDNPKFFQGMETVLAYPHRQIGVQHCYHDKRLAIAQGLQHFEAVTCIDVDARLTGSLPLLDWADGVSGYYEPIIPHVTKFTPERMPTIQRLAQKVSLDLNQATWIGESLFTVKLPAEKGQEFCDFWGKLARYLELHRVQAGAGNAIGMAAAKLGIPVQNDDTWKALKALYSHTDASQRRPKGRWVSLKRRLAYHRRLNATRLSALGEFDFYFR